MDESNRASTARSLALGLALAAPIALVAAHVGCSAAPAEWTGERAPAAVDSVPAADADIEVASAPVPASAPAVPTAPAVVPPPAVAAVPAAASAPRRARTDFGRFEVEWSPTRQIEFNRPFEISCRVTHASGAPADDAQVGVTAWMPAHSHGTVRQPKTTAQGDGRFHVTGLLFHMEGHWELLVDVQLESKFDRAKFDVVLVPEESAGAVEGLRPEDAARVLAMSPVPEAPDDPTNAYDLDERAAHLGQFLFFDARLSGSGRTSCATCHVPERSWSDGKPLASAEGQLPRRTMSLWNVGHQRWFFWDGRADSLWSQSLQPLEDPREMGGDRVAIARFVASDADVRRAYERVFGDLPPLDVASRFPARAKPDPTTPDGALAQAWGAMAPEDRRAIDRVFANVGKAIAAFQRKIVSRSSPFDEYVAGLREGDAERMAGFTAEARRGLGLFLGRANCHFCHSGPNFTDLEFHDTRLPRSKELSLDLGRFAGVMRLQKDAFNALGEHADGADAEARAKLEHLVVGGQVWGEFRTPTLREVGAGGPYMHQGQFATLEEVIDFYSDHVSSRTNHGELDVVLQPVRLSADEKRDLIAFLRSLTSAGRREALLRQPRSACLE